MNRLKSLRTWQGVAVAGFWFFALASALAFTPIGKEIGLMENAYLWGVAIAVGCLGVALLMWWLQRCQWRAKLPPS